VRNASSVGANDITERGTENPYRDYFLFRAIAMTHAERETREMSAQETDDDDADVEIEYPEIAEAIGDLVDAVRRHWPTLDSRTSLTSFVERLIQISV
jgi:hypothetical protein